MAHPGTTISSRRLWLVGNQQHPNCWRSSPHRQQLLSKITTTHRRCNFASSIARGTVAEFQGSMLEAEQRTKTLAAAARASPLCLSCKFSKRTNNRRGRAWLDGKALLRPAPTGRAARARNPPQPLSLSLGLCVLTPTHGGTHGAGWPQAAPNGAPRCWPLGRNRKRARGQNARPNPSPVLPHVPGLSPSTIISLGTGSQTSRSGIRDHKLRGPSSSEQRGGAPPPHPSQPTSRTAAETKSSPHPRRPIQYNIVRTCRLESPPPPLYMTSHKT